MLGEAQANAETLAGKVRGTGLDTGILAAEPGRLNRLAAAIYACDAEGRVTMFNDAAAELWGRRPELGVDAWCGSYRIFRPDGSEMPLEDCPMAVTLREGRAVRGREIVIERPDGSRRVVRPYPEPIRDDQGRLTGAINLLVDVTELHHAERRNQLLLKVYDLTRPLADPEEIIRTTAGLLGKHMRVSRCAYADVEPDQDRFNLLGDYVDGVPSIVGRYAFSDFGPECLASMRRGEPFVVNDTELDPRCRGAIETYRRTVIRSLICVPLLKAGKLVTAMAVHADRPRRWTDDDAVLVSDVAAHCWESIERIRLTRALVRSERRYRAIVESQSELICRFQMDGTILYVNDAYARVIGRPAESLVGANFWQFIPEESRPEVRDLLARLGPTTPEVSIENQFTTTAGTRWTLWTNRAIAFDDAGVPIEVQSGGIDFTDRKLAELALRDSESKFRAMADAAPVLIWIAGRDNERTWFNNRWLEFTGREMNRETSGGWTDLLHPDDKDECARTLAHARDAVEPFAVEYRLRRHDGAYRWLLDHGVPLLDENGGFTGFIGSCIDVTDRKAAEEALVLRERYLEAVIETTPECVKIVRLDGTLQYLNPAGMRIFDVQEGSPTPHMYDLVAPEHRDAYREMHERVCQGDSATLEFDVISLRGARRHMTTNAVPLRGEDGSLAHLALTRDITEHRKAEQALRESEERFRMLADNMSQFAWICNADGQVVWYNKRWYDYTGLAPRRIDGEDWLSLFHPDHADRVNKLFSEHLHQGTPWEDTFPIRGRDGQYRWFLSHAQPIRDADGKVVRWFGTHTDVTEQRAARDLLTRHAEELERRVQERTEELRKSHVMLRLSERMASLGTLSAGLGHDMGNLLIPVRVCVELLESSDLPPELASAVSEIKTSAQYLQQLANGLRLMVVDPERTSSAQAIDLVDWWADAQFIMRTALTGNVELSAEVEPGCRAAISKPALTQAVFNLVQNAGEAMRGQDKGAVRIQGSKAGDRVRLVIEDNGPGMPEEVRSRCLEPFFTTKTREISTGLGLVLVMGLIRDAGGSVDIESAPDRGTRFTLMLPVAGSEPTAAAGANATQPRAGMRIANARTRALAASELRAAGFDPQDLGPDAPTSDLPDLVLTDDAPAASRWAGPGRTVLLLDSDGDAGPGVTALGPRPRASVIRDAVRRCGARAGGGPA